MSIVILAEKSSQALAYVQAFQSSKKGEGYFSIMDPLFTEEVFITFGFGHLVELAKPEDYDIKYKDWKIDNLPIFPESYQFQVSADKKKQFKVVEKLLRDASTIIIATDSDREGENIAWSIIHHAGAFSNQKKYQRLWINSLEKEAIYDGFKSLKDGLDYIPLYKETQTRQISDWLIGMNASPFYSLLLQEKGVSGSFSIGRVQTPTLFLIYQRQRAIEAFNKSIFYELESIISTSQSEFKAILQPSQRFQINSEVAPFLLENQVKIGTQSAMIQDVTKKLKKSNSPLLFSLSNLQSKANQLYKASAKQVLEAVQGLYEAKFLTYPRTDSTYITENEFAYLKANLQQYQNFLNISAEATQLEARKRYVNSSKVQEHHAIILTKQVPGNAAFEKFSELQQKIYLLIAKTTVAMFLDDYQFEETVVNIKVGNLIFCAKGKVPKVDGWKFLFGNEKSGNDNETDLLPEVQEGANVLADVQIIEKETQPPKAYTEGTLIMAMKTAGKTVDDTEAQILLKEIEGIGTEATRASIIETLKSKAYIETQKNNLVVTEKGKALCLAVSHEKLLTRAEMTAKWESYLRKIGQGEGDQDNFITNIKKYIAHLIAEVPGQIAAMDFSDYKAQQKAASEKNTIGKCPVCNGDVVLKKSFYGCTQYPNCKFTLPNNFRKKKLTKSNLSDLLDGKNTVVKGIKNRDNKVYDVVIKANSKGYLEFVSFFVVK